MEESVVCEEHSDVYEEVEALWSGMNRCRIDIAGALHKINEYVAGDLSGDPVMIAMKAGAYDEESGPSSFPPDQELSDQLWKTAWDLGLEKRAATEGSMFAQASVAYIYLRGRAGVEQDLEAAVRYYSQAASCGNAEAQNNLGYMYEEGKGVKQNFSRAVEYYRLAADQGDSCAQGNLGLMYETGRGVQQCYKTARRYYELAMAQGDSGACVRLGDMLESMQRDGQANQSLAKEAFQLYSMAASQNHPAGLNCVGVMYTDGRGVEQDYYKAIECYRKAISLKNIGALTNMAYMYESGKGVPESAEQAFYYYKLAADRKDAHGQTRVAVYHYTGGGEGRMIEQSYVKAATYLKLAACQGDPVAMCYLGVLYHNGQGVHTDASKAIFYYEKSAEKGLAESFSNLGLTYKMGNGVKRDYGKAIKYFEQAVELGHRECQKDYVDSLRSAAESEENGAAAFQLGLLYRDGKYVNKAAKQARHFFALAAEHGHETAKKCLRLTQKFLFVTESLVSPAY